MKVWRKWMWRRQAEAEARVMEVVWDGEKHYGYELSKAAKLRPGRMYPTLSRLLQCGALEDGWGEGGRRWYRRSR